MPYTALAQILEAAGADPRGQGEVEIDGADPVFATRYRVGTAGAASLAALGLAAARLCGYRGDRHLALAAAVALVLGAGSVAGIVLLVVAGIMAVTASVGFCPLYTLLHLNTRGRRPLPH